MIQAIQIDSFFRLYKVKIFVEKYEYKLFCVAFLSSASDWIGFVVAVVFGVAR